MNRNNALGTVTANGIPRRPAELQDVLNARLYHPIAARMAVCLSGTPVTPNLVSVCGGLCVCLAALAYAQPGWPGPALLGLALHMAWHVLDGADGDLARMTGRASVIGEVIDGVADYTGHVVLYVVLAYLLSAQIGPAAWPLAVAAGASRIAQANHYEVQRRLYLWRAYGSPWDGSGGITEGGGALRAVLRPLLAGYLVLARQLAPPLDRTDAALRAAASDPSARAQIEERVRRQFFGSVRLLSPLSANQRTLVLGASMLSGSPVFYFVYEVVLLNVFLAFSIRRFRQASHSLEDQASN